MDKTANGPAHMSKLLGRAIIPRGVETLKPASPTAVAPALRSATPRRRALRSFGGDSLDDLVGAGEQLWRHVKAERLRSDQADDQIEFCWLLDRQITWTGPAQNLVYIVTSAPEEVRKVRSIRDKTTRFDIVAMAVHRR